MNINSVDELSLKFTPKQQKIMELVAMSYSNDEIAETLIISKETVKSHLKKIYRKI